VFNIWSGTGRYTSRPTSPSEPLSLLFDRKKKPQHLDRRSPGRKSLNQSARTQAPNRRAQFTRCPSLSVVPPRWCVWPCETVAPAGGRDQPLLRASRPRTPTATASCVCLVRLVDARRASRSTPPETYHSSDVTDVRFAAPACLLPAFKGKDTVNATAE
jgi:hypothetical protein